MANHEVFFYIFDSIPLAASVGVYIYFWPPHALNECAQVLPHSQISGSSVEMSHGKERAPAYGEGNPFEPRQYGNLR